MDLLTDGFRRWRRREFWERTMQRLSDHATPSGYPKYGYMLESDGKPVGVLLLIFATVEQEGRACVRCNVSSWYVKPEFRAFGSLLSSRAQRHKTATYFNITPAPWTWVTLEAQGYTRYCDGAVLALPALCRHSEPATVREVTGALSAGDGLSGYEREVLQAHAALGCMALTCTTRDGDRHPFVFGRRTRYRALPYAALLYSRDSASMTRFARAMGLYLLRRGYPVVVWDGNERAGNMVGTFSDKYPKFFKGSDPPRLCDHAFSERALFGV